MTENSLNKIFDTQTPEFTPSKRSRNTENDLLSTIFKGHSFRPNNKILVQDTPTPFMTRKSRTLVDEDINKNKPFSEFAKPNSIVPNTPIVRFNSSQNNKKVKKLFDSNALLLGLEEEDLPGDYINSKVLDTNKNSKNVQEQPKKFSSLFKPKSKLNNKENDSESDLGCDLSYETLEKRQRKRNNPLIARLSEIQDLEIIKQNKLFDKIEEEEGASPPSSPIVTRGSSYQTEAETFNTELTKALRTPNTASRSKITIYNSNGKTISSSASKFNTIDDYSSFTHVTKQIFEMTEKSAEKQSNKDNSCLTNKSNPINENSNTEVNNKSMENSKQDFDEADIDLILFGGLQIDSAKKPDKQSKMNKVFGLVDKTNTVSKFQKLKSNKRSSSISQRKTQDYKTKVSNTKRSLSANYDKKKYFPRDVKTFNLSYLDLKDDQVHIMKNVIEELETLTDCDRKRSKSPKKSQIINVLLNKDFTKNTTHLIVDFERTLVNEKEKLNINKKILLLLAALKSCKIVRYEWLIHSYKLEHWIDDKHFLFQNYITDDLDQYEETDFDIRLIKFIRNLERTDKISLFGSYGHIYLMDDRQNNSDMTSSNETFNESNDSFKFNDSFSIFKSKSKTYDYIYELITKCDGLLTSRAGCADLIILIDRLSDYENKKSSRAKIEHKNEMKYLKQRILDMKDILKSNKRKIIPVISSDWILDCVLENSKLDKDEYVLGCIENKSNL